MLRSKATVISAVTALLLLDGPAPPVADQGGVDSTP